jgi:hypothetical protein
MAARSRQLHTLAQALHRVAATYTVAVVVTNHVTLAAGAGAGSAAPGEAPFPSSAGDTNLEVQPALGEAWAHAAAYRVHLQWSGGGLVARLTKALERPLGVARCAIVADGFRGVRAPRPGVPAPAAAPASVPIDSRKRRAAQAGLSDERVSE